jgi:maltoporin
MAMSRSVCAPMMAGMLLAEGAWAVELHGYLRNSFGGNTQGGSQVCYGVPGMDYKFRLGNECDTYGELEFRDTASTVSGAEFRFDGMIAFFRPGDLSDIGANYENKVRLPNLYVQASKVPFLGGASVWLGARYYRRHDVHPLDFFYWNPSGLGGGFEDIGLGPGKLAVALFRTPDDNPLRVTFRADVRMYEIKVNPDGALEVGVDVGLVSDQASSQGPGRMKVSPWFTVEHVQSKLFGGSNRLAFQYAMGSLAGMGGNDNNANVNPDATSDSRQFRIVEMFQFQPIERVSGALVFVFQSKDRVAEKPAATPALAGDSSTSFSVELRPAYHFNQFFKIQADLGYASLTPKGGGDARSLFKATLAPTLVAGGSFWSRPELRVFATWAGWNDAAQIAGLAGSCSTAGVPSAPFACDTTGFSFGAQVEVWW